MNKSLTAGELEIMQVLWQHGTLKPAEMQKCFPRPIRNAALRSALLVLLDKGHVTRKKVGKVYFYSAVTRSESALTKMARRLADVFCGGSQAALIAQLIESEKLSKEDIEKLQQIASQKKPE